MLHTQNHHFAFRSRRWLLCLDIYCSTFLQAAEIIHFIFVPTNRIEHKLLNILMSRKIVLTAHFCPLPTENWWTHGLQQPRFTKTQHHFKRLKLSTFSKSFIYFYILMSSFLYSSLNKQTHSHDHVLNDLFYCMVLYTSVIITPTRLPFSFPSEWH